MAELGVFPTEKIFRKFFREKILQHRPMVEWNKENLEKAIEGCRADGGIPMFLTGYAGEDLQVGGKPASLMKCWGGKNGFTSVLLTDVPKEDFEEMKKRSGDWHFLSVKYFPEKYKKLLEFPVVL